jgi:hypothetical protein
MGESTFEICAVHEYGIGSNILFEIQGIPPGHEHLNIGRIKLHSSMTFI